MMDLMMCAWDYLFCIFLSYFAGKMAAPGVHGSNDSPALIGARIFSTFLLTIC